MTGEEIETASVANSLFYCRGKESERVIPWEGRVKLESQGEMETLVLVYAHGKITVDRGEIQCSEARRQWILVV